MVLHTLRSVSQSPFSGQTVPLTPPIATVGAGPAPASASTATSPVTRSIVLPAQLVRPLALDPRFPYSRGGDWCCIAEFEGCPKDPTQMGVCMPKNSPNPALSGPLSISDSPANTTTSSSVVSSQSSTPTPTPTPAGSSGLPPGAAAAAGAGGVVVFFTIAIGLYFFLKRKPREPREPPSGAVDMATQDNAREIQGVAIHELGLEGANKGTGVHELGLGETNKQGW